MKQGDIWVSAVLYIGIGIVAITFILGAAIPLIEGLKDKNTVTETKNLMYVLDKNIREVANEGPGSQRELSPFRITKGNFYIDDEDSDDLNWSLKTKAFIVENDATVKEGFIEISSQATNIDDENMASLGVHYDKIDITLESDLKNPFLGTYSILVKNTGEYNQGKLIVAVHVK